MWGNVTETRSAKIGKCLSRYVQRSQLLRQMKTIRHQQPPIFPSCIDAKKFFVQGFQVRKSMTSASISQLIDWPLSPASPNMKSLQ
jgi:hypothetical protein